MPTLSLFVGCGSSMGDQDCGVGNLPGGGLAVDRSESSALAGKIRDGGGRAIKDARLRACGIDILGRPAVCLAHTEFDGEEDWKFKNLPGYHFPPHAVEGAFSAAQIVCETAFSTSGPKLGRLVALGILSAIARHHGPRSSRLQPFQMHPQATGLIAPWVSGTPGSLANSPKSEDFEQLVRFGEADQAAVWVLYTLLIRLLRLADQGSLF